MGKRIKAGTKGKASKYITRTRAIKKLDIPLKDFRKLSILKGVFPRQPPKSKTNNSKTYYHLKDIQFLQNDRLIDHFRSLNTIKKKLYKAIVKRDKLRVLKLKRTRPRMDLNHVVRERYPTFSDALKDLDDPMTLLSLLAKFPVHRLFKISPEKVEIAKVLTLMFKAFVARQRLLTKVFLSTKGIYFQAVVGGQKVTWVEPYPFASALPFDVDYKIILTFTEIHQVILKTVIFKLFKENNLVYPPQVVPWTDAETSLPETDATFQNMKLMEAEAIATEDRQEIDPQFAQGARSEAKKKKLFEGLVFFISREVQKELFEFCVKSFGGRAVYHLENYQSDAYKNPEITHVLVDKPLDFVDKLPNREYVQPQWVCDSINFNVLLPIAEYVPGKALPPHLSPFVEDEKEGFMPDRKKEILKYQGEFVEESLGEEEGDGEGEDVPVEEQEEEEEPAPKATAKASKKASRQAAKTADADEPRRPTKYKVTAETYDHDAEEKQKVVESKRKVREEEKLSELMLTKKRQRLLNKIQNLDEKKKEKLREIVQRKKELKQKTKNH